MRSIFLMPSDDMAGDAKRRVPIPIKKEEGKCEAFFLMPSDNMAGDAKRRIPIPIKRRNYGAKQGIQGTGTKRKGETGKGRDL